MAEDVTEQALEPSVGRLRRTALLQDVLLACLAFTGGALFYAFVRIISDDTPRLWTIGLSDELVLSGLVAAELFVLWNDGLRQGLRGHSIGKHRVGLRVVRRDRDEPIGPVRGLLRGLVVVLVTDLVVAAVPIGLPTVLRRATPESWHVGAAAYVALLVLVLVVLLPSRRDLADLLTGSRVVRATGDDAVTAEPRHRALVLLEGTGVLGVVVLAIVYVAYYGTLFGHVPPLW
ncbi:MAG: RDD family protein [Aeromicrobium erythreum]